MPKFSIFIFLLITQVSLAQTGKVVYSFVLAEDGSDYTEGTLYISGQQSYFNYDKDGGTKRSVSSLAANEFSINTRERDSVGVLIFTDQEKQLYQQRYIRNGQIYIVDDPSLSFDWKINNEKRNINGFSCQSASLTHRGRKYKAWFTEEIAINAGPWKFHGLPGLIIKMSDLESKVTFTAMDIDIPADLPAYNFDYFPYEGIRHDWHSYKKLVVQEAQKRLDFIMSTILEEADGTETLEGEILQTEVIAIEKN